MTYDKSKSGLIDYGGVLRNSYRDSESAIDVINNGTSLVPAKFSKVSITRNENCQVSKVEYYNDDIFEITCIIPIADISGSLNNTYFNIYAGQDLKQYAVWYNVDGTGKAPNLMGVYNLEVGIQSGDEAEVIALATKLAINNYDEELTAELSSGSKELRITTNVGGETTNSSDNNTGFSVITQTEGNTSLVATIYLTYDTNGNINSIRRR